MSDEQPTAAGPRPFTGILQEQRKGALHHELSADLAELVAACIDLNKQGSLTLTLKVIPSGDNTVHIADTVKVNAPQPDKSTSLFFAASDGSISRTNPMQTELPLGVAPIRDRAVGE